VLLGITEIELQTHALAREICNRSGWRLCAGATDKQYHGFLISVGWIIEILDARDKQSPAGKKYHICRTARLPAPEFAPLRTGVAEKRRFSLQRFRFSTLQKPGSQVAFS
jgi:hypothetical protein